jgi:hypothetical protein
LDGRLPLVELLLQHGADVHAQGGQGPPRCLLGWPPGSGGAAVAARRRRARP